jgi:hypothetical protein
MGVSNINFKVAEQVAKYQRQLSLSEEERINPTLILQWIKKQPSPLGRTKDTLLNKGIDAGLSFIILIHN